METVFIIMFNCWNREIVQFGSCLQNIFFWLPNWQHQWAIPKTKDLILLVAFNQFSCKCNFCFQKSRSLDHRRTNKRIRPNSLSISEVVQIKKRPKSVGPNPSREFSHLFHKPSTPQEINKTFEDESYLAFKVLVALIFGLRLLLLKNCFSVSITAFVFMERRRRLFNYLETCF